ncbi:M15 family metallopeptidase [Marinobacterium lacunae]|uniref:M15 family metallopeptidase n=1 Tax=Marinobacterium lacunae TaxID=1232683 RepID=UPI001E43BA50|nr:M15 family metallopeptidase [Marinobacterium lacunae]
MSKRIGFYPAYYKMNVANSIPECHVRSQVFDRLLHAASLLPKGIQLVVLDGWRPFAVQQYLFDTLVNLIMHTHVQLTSEEVNLAARNLVSPPSTDPRAPSPHLTGGSVDVTLADDEGRFLDMGSLFDEASPSSWTYYFEDKSLNSRETLARNNRRMLFNAMTKSGFTNLPSEWWHYDFGNQLWAYNSGNQNAIYGATRPLGIEKLWQKQLSRDISSR